MVTGDGEVLRIQQEDGIPQMEGITNDRVQQDTMCQRQEPVILPLSGENFILSSIVQLLLELVPKLMCTIDWCAL